MRPLLAALLLAFFGVFSTARGDGSGPPPGAGTGCELCEGKGWLPCVHAWESLKGGSDPVVPGPRELDVGPLTVGTFLCSECLAMPCCQGLGWTPCPKCATKEIRDFREARLQECREVMERRRQDIDSRTGSKPLHLRSAHYELVWELPGDTVSVYVDNKERTYRDGFLYDEIPRARVNKRRAKISSHLRAHLYARRLEECWEQFSRTFDPDGQHPLWPPLSSDRWQDYVPNRGEKANPPDLKDSKLEATLLKAGTPIREWVFLFGPRIPGSVQGLGGPEKFKDMKTNMALGGAYFFSFLGSDGGSQAFQTDDLYHQYLYHNVSELLIHDYVISGDDYEASFHRSAHRRVPWQDFPDWMHEAWARVQEMDRFGNAAVACHEEVARTDFQRGKRGQYVEKLQAFLAAGKLVPFSEISRLIRDRFTTKIHMQIWYMMDYLRRRDPAKFPVLIARTKCISCERNDEKEGFLRALEEVYNLTPLGFEEAWQADLAKAKGE